MSIDNDRAHILSSLLDEADFRDNSPKDELKVRVLEFATLQLSR